MMPRIGTHVVGSFFLSALLPPRDGDEPSFYDILGLDGSATAEELRKAYRKLSLKLHPDKIAQRGGDSTKKEEAAAEYEKIQEAYHVLIDEKKRLKYDALGTPTRYRFVERGGFADPQSLYENLTSASFNDKSRLVVLFFIAILLVLMQPILIAAKVNQTLRFEGPLKTSSWIAIMVPYWVVGALFIILTFVAALFVPATDRLPICLTGVEQFFWYLGTMFLCFKWDEKWDDSVPYRQALTPIYFAMLLRWSRAFLMLQKVRKDVNRMVTSDYIENEFLKGRSMEDLEEEEQADLMKAFLVVSVDPEFEPHAEELTAEELEEEKVESSPEYESATEIYNKIFNGLSCSLVFGSIFLILLTLKLDDRLKSGANWWAVFSPFWIERGGRLALSLYKCCCGGISGEEVVLYAGENLPAAFEVDDSNDKESEDVKMKEASENEDSAKTPSIETKIRDEIETNASPDSNETNAKDDGKIKNSIGDSKKEENEDTNDASTEKSIEKTDQSNGPSSAGKNDGGDDNDGDDDDEIHIDEDTYRAFQSAYQQAEKDAKQERTQSCTESCVLLFHIILLCLVVAKIEKNYDSEDTNDVGFNVFWILFPFFLFFGLSCCCCAILIFGAEPDTGETDGVEDDPENPPINDDENPDEVTIISVAPTEEEAAIEATVAPEKQTENQINETTSEKFDPSDDNMEDLD